MPMTQNELSRTRLAAFTALTPSQRVLLYAVSGPSYVFPDELEDARVLDQLGLIELVAPEPGSYIARSERFDTRMTLLGEKWRTAIRRVKY